MEVNRGAAKSCPWRGATPGPGAWWRVALGRRSWWSWWSQCKHQTRALVAWGHQTRGCTGRSSEGGLGEELLPLCAALLRHLGVLGLVLGSPVQERLGHTGVGPVQGHSDGEGPGAPLGRGEAGRAGAAQPGEEMAWGDPPCL